MNTFDLARRLADYYGLPVRIINAKRNPLEYRQKDNSLILREDFIQKLPKEERIKIVRQIAATCTCTGTGKGEGQPSMTIEDIQKLPKKERIALARKFASSNWVIKEGKQATLEGTASIPHLMADMKKRQSGLDNKHLLPDTMRVELIRSRKSPRVKIGWPEDVAQFLRHVADYDRESAKILHLDTKNQVIGVENISTGSLNASIVHPREAVKGAILNNSNAVIFVHNHPSGNPEPSREDKEVHKNLKAAFGTVGIDLLDSIIIGKDGHYSLKEKEGL